MGQPFNYILNTPDPTEAVRSGINTAVGLQGVIDQRNAAEQQALAAQAERENRMRLQAELATVAKNPTTDSIVQLMIKNPSLSKQFDEPLKNISEKEKQAKISQALPIYAASLSGNTEEMQRLLAEQATAYENSGMTQDAKYLTDLAKIAETNPKNAALGIGSFLANAMGSDKFMDTFKGLGGERRAEELQPANVTEAQAKANKAAVDSKYAESNAVIDLQKKGWDITKIQQDISIAKENNRIAALNAATQREANAIKKQENELKLQEMMQKRDDAIREKVATVETARLDMDNFLNTADRILKTPMNVVGSAAGPISSRMPTTTQDTADFEELINTLGSQSFMSQISKMKGTGALSEKEGEKLQASLQSVSLRQSPERLIENIKEAQRLILKARGNLVKRYGVPEGIPDTPNAEASASEIEALLKKYGGQ
ncbi:hypothetical protein UFOVP581_28 [uncultured Caudovirales phage]|uniref:Uncharacterized protein n=1 Tax=uncultured Caudovirales phage TaxID=2100421 RepID=A0A6J5PCQ8_9CAUD|nr:hypothetical protein UFOVP581_28 [uncultured Caudovirales phage]